MVNRKENTLKAWAKAYKNNKEVEFVVDYVLYLLGSKFEYSPNGCFRLQDLTISTETSKVLMLLYKNYVLEGALTQYENAVQWVLQQTDDKPIGDDWYTLIKWGDWSGCSSGINPNPNYHGLRLLLYGILFNDDLREDVLNYFRKNEYDKDEFYDSVYRNDGHIYRIAFDYQAEPEARTIMGKL